MSIRSTDDWQRYLEAELGYPVVVRYGRSRTAPVQLLPGPAGARRGYLVRLHRFFESASEETMQDLAAWMRAGKRARAACSRLDAWIAESNDALPERKARPEALRPVGVHQDLAPLATRVLEHHFASEFENTAAPPVTWGKREKSRARRSLRLGSYCSRRHLVRLHPVLDSPDVPAWFLESVLHHEFLHAAIPCEIGAGGRQLHHGPGFRSRERAHSDHARAVAWQHAHIGHLIRCARKGAPFRVSRWR